MASESNLARLLTVCLILASTAGCSKKAPSAPQATAQGPLRVYAVNYPLSYFATRLAPSDVEVRLPVPESVDPAYWRPSADIIAEYQAASVILLNGAGYAGWTRYATLPRAKTLVTAQGCREAFLPSGENVEHRHGPGGAHTHADTAFTTWLDLRLAVCQAAHVRDALSRLSPGEQKAIEARFEALERDLLSLDERLRRVAKHLAGQPLLASHPVYQYLADAYELSIESLHFEPDQALDAEALADLDARLDARPASWMLWEASPLPSTERELQDRRIEVVVFEPLAQPPREGDFLEAMRNNVARLACAAGAEACP